MTAQVGYGPRRTAARGSVLLTLARHSSPSSIRLLPPQTRPADALACYYIRGYAAGMVLELKLRKVGNSVGVVLPKEALARLNVAEGDTLALTDSPDGSLRVTPATEGREQFAAQMKAAEGIIRRYRNTLRELAQ